MATVRKIPISKTKYQYHFICLGCDQEHAFNDETWKWNHDYDKPTLSPSYLMRGHRYSSETKKHTIPFVCHSFIKDGMIQYLGDCTHELAGKTVELPQINE